jgi:hypothetical protein
MVNFNDKIRITSSTSEYAQYKTQVSRLDGTDRRTIVKDDSLEEPRAIVVDPIRG